jgi:hypothetical protein
MVYPSHDYGFLILSIVWDSKKLGRTLEIQFQKLCSAVFLEYQTMKKLQKPSNPDQYFGLFSIYCSVHTRQLLLKEWQCIILEPQRALANMQNWKLWRTTTQFSTSPWTMNTA